MRQVNRWRYRGWQGVLDHAPDELGFGVAAVGEPRTTSAKDVCIGRPVLVLLRPGRERQERALGVGLFPDLVGDPLRTVLQPGGGLGRRECRRLRIGAERGFTPRRYVVQPLVGVTGFLLPPATLA
jgi:hypothetical protein